jgi:guanyl-specific ribonuclease Sa
MSLPSCISIKATVKSGVYSDSELGIKNITSTVTDTNAVTKNVEGLSVESYVNPTSSQFNVSTLAQAIPTTMDYTKVAGVTVTATDKNNKVYQGTLESNTGNYLVPVFSNLPVTSEQFVYHIHVPGHFQYNKPFTVFGKRWRCN